MFFISYRRSCACSLSAVQASCASAHSMSFMVCSSSLCALKFSTAVLLWVSTSKAMFYLVLSKLLASELNWKPVSVRWF